MRAPLASERPAGTFGAMVVNAIESTSRKGKSPALVLKCCMAAFWLLVVVGTSCLVATLFAFVSGVLLASYQIHDIGRDCVMLLSVICFACATVAWCVCDRRFDFMRRSTDAVVEYW